MFDTSLFGDLEPRGSKEQDKKLISKLSQKARTPSSSRGNTLKDKVEWIRHEVDRHLSFLFDKVEACREEDRLRTFFDNFIQQDKGAIDTETLGLDYFKDKIYGWSTWAEGEKSLYVPVLHKGYVSGNDLDRQISPEFIGSQLQRVKDSNTKLVYHNAKFDMHMIYHNFGVMLPVWWDTMIASRLLHSSERDHSLKYQYNVKVKKDAGKPYDFKTLFSGIDPNLVPIDIMTPYAAGDTFETLGLQKYQEEEFKKYPGIYNVFKNIEMPLLPVIVDMEERGVCVDLDVLKQMKDKYLIKYESEKKTCLEELDKYSDKINAYNLRNPGKLSNQINLGSPTQVAILFYDIIGLPESQKYKRGTGKKVLDLYKDKNEFVKKLSSLRDAEKLVNGFINSIPEYIREDGKVHPDFIQIKGTGNTNEEDEENGADTGRFSCVAPNLQQIPGRGEKSELRKMFKASPGYIMLSSDYSLLM
jgi:DNA polymerase I